MRRTGEKRILHCAGKTPAEQGRSFRELLAAVCSGRWYFWDYGEREILLDQPADLGAA
jgi:hypothetical protein